MNGKRAIRLLTNSLEIKKNEKNNKNQKHKKKYHTNTLTTHTATHRKSQVAMDWH